MTHDAPPSLSRRRSSISRAALRAPSALAALAERIAERVAHCIAEQLSPLVFYVGSTGLIPAELSAESYSITEAAEALPQLRIPKSFEDGMIFKLGEGITLSVSAKEILFSRDHGR